MVVTSATGEAFQPSFSLSGFQEAKGKENMAFHFFYKRIHQESKHAKFEPKVIKLRQFANPVNFWFGMSGTAFDKPDRKFINQEVLSEMPRRHSRARGKRAHYSGSNRCRIRNDLLGPTLGCSLKSPRAQIKPRTSRRWFIRPQVRRGRNHRHDS